MLTLASAPTGIATCCGGWLMLIGGILVLFGLGSSVLLFISRHEPQNREVKAKRAKSIRKAIIFLAVGVGLLVLYALLLNLSLA